MDMYLIGAGGAFVLASIIFGIIFQCSPGQSLWRKQMKARPADADEYFLPPCDSWARPV